MSQNGRLLRVHFCWLALRSVAGAAGQVAASCSGAVAKRFETNLRKVLCSVLWCCSSCSW